MDYTTIINEAVSYIHNNAEKTNTIAKKLLPLKETDIQRLDSFEIKENNFIKKIRNVELNSKIGGVDSGFVNKKIGGIDIFLIRTSGIVFEYQDSKVVNANYEPGFFEFPTPYTTNNALDNDELECSNSLKRLTEEIKAAKKLIEKYKIQYCFLDGSVIPQYLDKPRQDSKINHLYHGLLREFQELYKTAKDSNCFLVGCIEDSRGSRFRTLIQENILTKKELIDPEKLDHISDSNLLDCMLEVGERTLAITYSSKIKEHPILNDFDEKWAKNIYLFYLKPSKYDRPLRVEFLCPKGEITKYADQISSAVFKTASLHREYAYPAVLIEADMRARLKPEEINTVFNKIMDKLSKHIKIGLRRNNRPF